MLPCQHTFCLLCVQKCAIGGHSGTDSAKIRCAQCRSEVILPKEGVSALPGNIYLQSVLDLLESDYSSVEESKCCSSCQTVCDLELCEHCNNSFCRVCMERHIEHLGKQLVRIKDQLEITKEKVLHRIKNFEEYCSKLKSEIHAAAQMRIQAIVDSESELLQIVEQTLRKGEVAWKDPLEKLQSTTSQAQDLLGKGFGDVNSSAEKVMLFLKMHRESSSAISESSVIGVPSVTFNSESFSVSTEVRPESPEEEDEDEDSQSPMASPPPSIRMAPAEDNKISEIGNAHSRFYRARSFAPKCRLGVGQLQRPSGVAVSPWSREIYVVAMDSHRIHVFESKSGKFKRSFGCRGQQPGEFLCPFGIALSPVEQQILVTDKWKHCIHVFDRNGQFIRQIGTKGRSPGFFRSPESICVDQNGRIYICDTCNNRIQVLDKDGAFLNEIGVAPTEGSTNRPRSMFHELAGIAVSKDGQRLVVCDFGNHRIYVFSGAGKHLLTFGQKGTLKGQFIHPECVAIDNKGFIIVGDSGNGRVQVCRPDGKYVRAFGSKGSHGSQFSWISGLAVSDRYEIVVSDFKNHSVQIF